MKLSRSDGHAAELLVDDIRLNHKQSVEMEIPSAEPNSNKSRIYSS